MAVGAAGLVCLSLYWYYWLEEKKRQLLWRYISNVFWQTKHQIPFCWSLLICCPHPLELAACHAFTASCRASLVSSKASPSFIWISQGWSFRDSISADPWISTFLHLSGPLFQCCFLWLLELCFQSVIMNSCPKPIVHDVLYCLDRAAAVWCLFCPLKWGYLSLTLHLWRKCLQLLCWYILSFILEKFSRFCCGWVMSDV